MEALEHYSVIRPELGERFASAVVETAEEPISRLEIELSPHADGKPGRGKDLAYV